MNVIITEVLPSSAWYPDDHFDMTQGQVFELTIINSPLYEGYTDGVLIPIKPIFDKHDAKIPVIIAKGFKYKEV